MSDPIRKPDEFPSRSESILSDTIGLEGYSIETPPRSRIEKLLIELKEIIDQGGGSSTAYATSLEITMDEYFVMSATLKNKDGDTLGQVQTVDLPLESVVVNGSYDSINKNVVLTLENGNTVSFSVADLVSGLQTEITSNNKLDADLVNDTNSTHKFTTASDISKLAGIEEQANKTTIDDALSDSSTNPVQNKVVKTALDSKADASTTYTKTEVDTALARKLGTDTHYAGSSTTGGSANSAVKLDNSTDAGSATQPVYFSSGVPTATTYSLAKSVPADAVFTDTTYESKSAASGGTDVSLVTTGDKYIWNNKQNTIDANSKLSADLVDDTNTTHKFATAAQLSQITTNENNILSVQEQANWNSNSGVKNKLNYTGFNSSSNSAGVSPFTTKNVTYKKNADDTISAYTTNAGASGNAFCYLCDDNGAINFKQYFDGKHILSCDVYSANHYALFYKIDGETSVAVNGDTLLPNRNNITNVYIILQVYSGEIISESIPIVFNPMIRLSSISDSTYQPHAMSNAELTAKEQVNENNILKDKAALVELVDSGAKNIADMSKSTFTPTQKDGVTVTLSSDSIISSGNSGTGTNNFFNVYFKSTTDALIPSGTWVAALVGTGIDNFRIEVYDNTKSDMVKGEFGQELKFTIGNGATGSYVRITTKPSTDCTGSFKLLICSPAAWDISHEYQPYRPPYQELYERTETNENNISSLTPTTTTIEYTATAAETWEKTSLSISVDRKKAVYFMGNIMYNNAEPLGVGIGTGNTFTGTSIIAVEESAAGTFRGALSCTGIYYNNSSSPRTLDLWVKYKTAQKNMITLMYRQL